MTAPVPGSLHSWKTGRRCLPEIHATRLSVSGSLRPKLGLLMLLVVLMITLVLLGVPLVTKLLAAPATPTLPQPIHLSLLESLHTSNQNLVVSPSLLQETLANLAKWTQGGTR